MEETPDIAQDENTEPVEAPKKRGLFAPLLQSRTLMLCAILSALIHASLYFGLNIRQMFSSEADIEFSRSVGIALLQRAGVVPPQGAAAPPKPAAPAPPAPEPAKPEEPKPEEPKPEPKPEEPKPEPKPEEPKPEPPAFVNIESEVV